MTKDEFTAAYAALKARGAKRIVAHTSHKEDTGCYLIENNAFPYARWECAGNSLIIEFCRDIVAVPFAEVVALSADSPSL